MAPQKLLMTNLVYGKRYSEVFLEQNLKSLLDPRNIPAHKDKIEYLLFTDEETLPIIKNHVNYFKLQCAVQTHVRVFHWPNTNVDRFQARYQLLIDTFKQSVQFGLEKNMFVSALVADLVFANNYVEKLFEKLNQGYESIFAIPVRSANEALVKELNKYENALSADDLYKVAFENMHPLWLACHWESIHFSKIPFSLIWREQQNLIVKSFAVTPVVFKPTHEMLSAQGVIDAIIPEYCTNPYWASDWVECPLVGCEFLDCYYPPFSQKQASIDFVTKWAQQSVHPLQHKYLRNSFFYPRKGQGAAFQNKQNESDQITDMICRNLQLK